MTPNPPFLQTAAQARARLAALSAERLRGEVAALSGLAVELRGLGGHLSVGDRLALHPRDRPAVEAEVVGFRDGLAQALAFGPLDGLGPGRPAVAALRPLPATLAVTDGWIGRVLDPLGRPLDGRGQLPQGAEPRPLRAPAPPAAIARAPRLARRFRRQRARRLRHLPAGPAARPVRRLRRRQIDAARHAGAPCRERRGGAGAGRRARARGARVPGGRTGRSRAGAVGGGGRHLRRAAAAAARGRLCRHDRLPSISATRGGACCC